MSQPGVAQTYQGLPAVKAEVMRTLDDLAAQKYKIPVMELMENAGRAVARETACYIREKMRLEVKGTAIVVCCGRGSNGGDGLVAARALKEMGAQVFVFICPPRKPAGPAPGLGVYPELVRINLERARSQGVAVREAGPESHLHESLDLAAVVLDAVLGTGFSGKPSGAVYHMIMEMVRSKKTVLSVDLPSGLEPNTGDRSGPAVSAAMTFTLGLPKLGLLTPQAKKYVGDLKVLDIGYPPELIKDLFK